MASRRSIWKGSITVGLITLPVGLYSATEERDIRFNLLDPADGTRIKMPRCNADTGQVVEHPVKGFDLGGGRFVTFTDDEITSLAPQSSKTIDLDTFVPVASVRPEYRDTTYHVLPQEIGAKVYDLLALAMRDASRSAIGKVSIRSKERPALLESVDGALLLTTLRWPDEVRSVEHVPAGANVVGPERGLMVSLVDALSGDFDPGRYTDAYRASLLAAIEAKAEGLPPEMPTTVEPDVNPLASLTALIEATVAAAVAKRGAA